MSRFAALLYGFAGVSGLTVVALSAVAAHGLARFAPAGDQAVIWFHEATAFQMNHTLALVLATLIAERLPAGLAQRLMRVTAALFVSATVLFPGALYSVSFGGPAVTAPVGGISAMAGWALFGVAAWLAHRAGKPDTPA